ncbi:MAG: hypothetical protein KAT93_06935 [Desulfuromonadales bacterium]|jgi:uncharacterized membrane protein|nr:hypothetical protein [Desulfuromonadales bacterium]
MNSKLSLQMTLLGLAVLAFYAGLLVTGRVSVEVLPQFAVSAVIFLCSGRIMRQMAAKLPERDKEEAEEKPEPDWALRTLILNWVAAAAIVGVVAIFLVKPAGMTFVELARFFLYTDFAPEITIPFAP